VVSAGPTYEDLDPGALHRQPQQRQDGVRDRRRSGARGRDVVLVAGPVHLPDAGRRAPHRRAFARRRCATRCSARCRPGRLHRRRGRRRLHAAQVAPQKIKKQPGHDTLVLELVRTPDILADVAAHAARPRLVVGFAAETDDVAHYARGKLRAKRVDLIAATRRYRRAADSRATTTHSGVFGARRQDIARPGAQGGARRRLLDLIEERLPVIGMSRA
jgi:phosphopantothenoylcysteine decarboxylase/phosphopantothenate--cysteine ligase